MFRGGFCVLALLAGCSLETSVLLGDAAALEDSRAETAVGDSAWLDADGGDSGIADTLIAMDSATREVLEQHWRPSRCLSDLIRDYSAGPEDLIEHVIETVHDRFGVRLEPEVIIIGDR